MSSIRNWKLKGTVQKVLSVIPGGVRLNDELQVSMGGLRNFESNIAAKLDDWLGLISYLDIVQRGKIQGITILEVGTGWCPTLPLAFALAGAGRILTVDLNRHLKEDWTFRMLGVLERHLPVIAKAGKLPLEEVSSTYRRFRQATSAQQLLSAAAIEYRAPEDASNLSSLPDGCVDLEYSNSVMEHVPGPVIAAIMRESCRVLKDDGLVLHAVACNDHYANFDSTISFVNYLQFSERQWCRWNNPIQYQNRLRAPDFLQLARENGLEILHEARHTRPGTREALATMKLAPEFASYTREDLEATTIDFVARKKAKV
jgi:SAM-dependent methyltransferase